MTDSTNTPAPTPTTAQLIEALRSAEPNAACELGIELLESGKVNPASSIADLAQAIREHYAQQ